MPGTYRSQSVPGTYRSQSVPGTYRAPWPRDSWCLAPITQVHLVVTILTVCPGSPTSPIFLPWRYVPGTYCETLSSFPVLCGCPGLTVSPVFPQLCGSWCLAPIEWQYVPGTYRESLSSCPVFRGCPVVPVSPVLSPPCGSWCLAPIAEVGAWHRSRLLRYDWGCLRGPDMVCLRSDRGQA